MKKLLTILGSVGLVATTSVAVIACGDKTPSVKPIEKTKKEENTKSTEIPKKEEKKEETKLDFSKVEGKNIGNFQPDNKKTIPQTNIKKRLAELLNVHESNLTNLDVDYTNNKGKVTLPKFDNKTLNFTFTSILELGEIKFKDQFISLTEVKQKISDLLKIEEKYINELNVDLNKNSGTFISSKPSTFSDKFEFQFSTKEETLAQPKK
ncbi:lipoprotein [Mycoplasma mycoides subsp. capri]|uniref:lipoprotein n=1 Tax=Mycoplasma mycoides TaxID=2102 RepID=UPI002240C590|nr:lipoprotein [Mycoplasma mycoides]QVK01970.1 lipoprotein [Mycoplasma mycoides subsp. capri]